MFTKLSPTGRTCTVRLGTDGTLCGKPATLAFRNGRGEEFAECAEHELPLPVDKVATPKTTVRNNVKCRSCGHVHTFGPCGVRVGPGHRDACSCTDF